MFTTSRPLSAKTPNPLLSFIALILDAINQRSSLEADTCVGFIEGFAS